MGDLATAHEAVRTVAPNTLSRPELYQLIADLERLRNRVDERLMAAKATLDGLHDSGADSSIVGRSVGRRSQRQATRDTLTARALAAIPTLADGLAEGRLNVEHAAIVADVAEQLPDEVAAELVPVAESMPADLFAKKARSFVGRHTTASEAETQHRRQRDARGAWHHVATDGSVELRARFDRATGEAVVAALKQRTDQFWHADGGRDGSPDELRSHTQRRADALATLITETPIATDRSVHPKFQVHIVCTLSERTVTWLDGTPVPDSVMEHIGPMSDVIAHIFSGDGQPLWQGRSKRLATAAQWRSLIAKTRGCAACGADIGRCQAHHLREWTNHGTTDLDNLELLCHTCHGVAHRGSRSDRAQRRRTTPFRARQDEPLEHTLTS
ncbi:MAG: DUF222 domain-containing protein [Actinomycetota bacterium]